MTIDGHAFSVVTQRLAAIHRAFLKQFKLFRNMHTSNLNTIKSNALIQSYPYKKQRNELPNFLFKKQWLPDLFHMLSPVYKRTCLPYHRSQSISDLLRFLEEHLCFKSFKYRQNCSIAPQKNTMTRTSAGYTNPDFYVLKLSMNMHNHAFSLFWECKLNEWLQW